MRALLPILSYLLLFVGVPLAGLAQRTEAIATAEARSHAARQGFRSSPETRTYDLVYQRAQWEIDPARRYIKGAITSHFIPQEQALSELWFDLDGALRVDSVLYQQQKIGFDQDSPKLLRIALPASLPASRLDSVTVYYQGVPPATGWGSFEQAQHSSGPIVWTLSEPYGARDWWPCKQSLEDKIDSIDIWIRTPLGNKAASNGLLVAERQEGQQMVYHWQHRYPIVTYLVALAVTNYVAFSDQVPTTDGAPIQVLNYVFPQSEAQWRQQSGQIAGMMQLFNELFGRYPFADEKYGHAQFSWGGGMEHQTMSFMVNLNYDLMAHELAHQWFGNKITCGSWQDIWINEGFATYLTGLTKERLGGPAAWQIWKQNLVNSITAQPGGSVWVPDTTSVSRIFDGRLSYNKGAYVLHMLRWVVGDEAFFSGIRNYLNDPQLAFGFARAQDVQRHLEASSGKDLTEFFSDWYYGQGYPSYVSYFRQSGSSLTISLSQTTSLPASVDFFEMPVPVELIGRNGLDRSTVVLDHRQQEQQFTLEVPFEVAEMRIDPELWILSANNNPNGLEEKLLALLELYPNPTHNRLVLEAKEGLRLQEIILIDSLGRQLGGLSRQDAPRLELQTRALAPGHYLLRIKTNKGWVSKRFTRH
ncbi:M1 family aminopeptidase [Cesiribacter andamanensis]|uniref:Aminopeptidase N n=1 Tax=Cesiribacter andamanensis AMV16 TaxID=1279009 RepID=M7MY71_9BACT|nr:M1 family aminopeptidase [Cesiribacter andamanensis]EMR01388.1 Aminopeptidase N [Cesiribacter andamanensis AMV16]